MPKNLYACMVETPAAGENQTAQNTVLFCEAATLAEAQRQIQQRAAQQIAASSGAGLMTVFPVELTNGIGAFSWGLIGGQAQSQPAAAAPATQPKRSHKKKPSGGQAKNK